MSDYKEAATEALTDALRLTRDYARDHNLKPTDEEQAAAIIGWLTYTGWTLVRGADL